MSGLKRRGPLPVAWNLTALISVMHRHPEYRLVLTLGASLADAVTWGV